MKKWTVLVLLAGLALANCDDKKSSGGGDYPVIKGVWDFNLAPDPNPDEEYTIAVEIPGGSGAAAVSILGPGVADSATVSADRPVTVGDCGVTITFMGDTTFSLASGDAWVIAVQNGEIGQALPGNSVDSVTGGVVSGGTYSCTTDYCDGSALGSSVPFPTKGIGQQEREGGQWLTVRIRQDQTNITAQIPEQHVLSLFAGTIISGFVTTTAILPPLILTGDTVTLSYRRTISADGLNGDYFRVLITNGTDYLEPEYLDRDRTASGDTTVNYTFTVDSEVQIDFMAGLSDPGEYVVLDQVRLSTPAGVVFEDNFEAPPAGVCSPVWGADERWELRSPQWRIGEFCVSANGALEGAYSARWNGGSYREVSGSIISGASASGIMSLVGLGGADLSALAGILFEVWEPIWTMYFTSFSMAQQAPGSLVGTFKGESRDHTCIENGQLTSARRRASEMDLSQSYLVVRIDGSGVDCLPELTTGDTLLFGDTLATATGDTLEIIQLGGFFMATEDLVDDYANALKMSGLLSGNLITFTLEETGGLASMNGIGAVVGDQIVGALTGRMVFDAGRVCELTETAFVINLVEK